MKKDWKIISIQLPEELIKSIKKKCNEETITVSAYIRRCLIKEVEYDIRNKK